MIQLNPRGAGLLGSIALLVYACGGSSFSSGDSGAAGTGGASASSGASSIAGKSSGGTSSAGKDSGGASGAAGEGEAGAAEGGSSSGGTSSGGMSNGGVTSGGTSSAGAAGKAGSGGSGGETVRNSGDCVSDSDCSGGKCQALYPGGFRACVTPIVLTCTTLNVCCPSAGKNCAAGTTCVKTPLGPSCGGALMQSKFECAMEGCSTADDCTGNNAICMPEGAFDYKISTCLTGGCRLDADCKAETGGKCEPVTTNCCDGPSGLYCVYPTKGCRSNADCASGSTCQIVNDKTGECVAGAANCAG